MKNRCFFVFLLLPVLSFGQNLLEILENEQVDSTAVSISFKGTRIGLGHSIETRGKNNFELSIGQRYWNDGEAESSGFLVDQVCTTFALDYAFNDRLTVGGSASTLISVANSFVKYRLTRQTGNDAMPVSLTFAQTLTYKLENAGFAALRDNFSDKLGYTSQLLIARKFTDQFSLQLSPTFIHRGSNRFDIDDQNHFVLGLAGRFKLTPHFELFSEYFYQTNPLKSVETFDTFSIGGNWEVSDLLLQFMFTNGRPYAEDLFTVENPIQFNIRNQNLTFGFKATYTFQL